MLRELSIICEGLTHSARVLAHCTNKTGAFPPKCRTCCKHNNIQNHVNEELPNMELLIKTGLFWAWDEQEAFGRAFLGMGPSEQKASQYMHKCINTYVVCSCNWPLCGLGQHDSVRMLCFTESEAFETKQLADV